MTARSPEVGHPEVDEGQARRDRRRFLLALAFFLVCLAVFVFFAAGGLFH